MSSTLFLGLKLLTERKRQALISILGVAMGVAAFIAMSAIMKGFQTYFIKQAVDVNAHITLSVEDEEVPDRILRTAYGDGVLVQVLGSKPKDIKDKITEYRYLLRKYRDDERVLGVSPHLTGEAILNYGTKEESAQLIGIDAKLEKRASVVDRFLESGDIEKLTTDRNSLILGKELAKDLGVKEIGNKLTVTAPNGSLHLLKVVDFFNSGITSIDESRVYINLRTLQAILDKPNEVNELIFKVRDVDQAVSLAEEISTETGYKAQSWQEAYKNFLDIFKMQDWITYMIVFAILIVSAFGIFNIMMMTVLEKKKDIAILKAIGYTDGEVTKIFVFQGMLVGLLGALLGCVIGYLIQEWLASLDFEVQGMVNTRGFVLDRDPAYFLYGFIFAVFFSFFASFYPSWRASRLFPVDIFRSGG